MIRITTGSKRTAPRWFSLLAITGLLWNLLRLYFFYIHGNLENVITPAALEAMTEAERMTTEATMDLVAMMPPWVVLSWAVSVYAGVFGCILMILRRNLAVPVLGLSITGLLMDSLWRFLVADMIEMMGPTTLILPAVVLAIAILLLFAAIKARSEGWSR